MPHRILTEHLDAPLVVVVAAGVVCTVAVLLIGLFEPRLRET